MAATTRNRQDQMRAVVQRGYGLPDVLAVADVEVPPIGAGDVLVRVHAAAVNPGDLFTVMGRPLAVRLATGLTGPRRPVAGRALAGTVERVGARVSRFSPGDEVYAEVASGAYAEYASVSDQLLAYKPRNLSFVQAAVVPLAGVTALQGLRDTGRVGEGSRVLINGASGGVGTLAVQIARALGAEVTAVCSTSAIELVRSLGAHHVVDYTREDFTRGGRQDVVFDLVGNRSLRDCRRALAPTGTLVLASGPPSPTIRRILKGLALSPFTRQRLVPLAATKDRDDLDHLTGLIEAETITPIVERTFPLDRAADALRHQQAGHARGRTVITV